MSISIQNVGGKEVAIAYNCRVYTFDLSIGRAELSRQLRKEASVQRDFSYGLFSEVKGLIYCYVSGQKAVSVATQVPFWWEKFRRTEEGVGIGDSFILSVFLGDSYYFCDVQGGICVPNSEKVLVEEKGKERLGELSDSATPFVLCRCEGLSDEVKLPEGFDQNIGESFKFDVSGGQHRFVWLPWLFLKNRLFHPVFLYLFLGFVLVGGVGSQLYISHYEKVKAELAEKAKLAAEEAKKAKEKDKEKAERVALRAGDKVDFSGGKMLEYYISESRVVEEGLIRYGLSEIFLNVEKGVVEVKGKFPGGNFVNDPFRLDWIEYLESWARDNRYVFEMSEQGWSLKRNRRGSFKVVLELRDKAGKGFSEMLLRAKEVGIYGNVDGMFHLSKGKVGEYFIFVYILRDFNALSGIASLIDGYPFSLKSVNCSYVSSLLTGCSVNLLFRYDEEEA